MITTNKSKENVNNKKFGLIFFCSGGLFFKVHKLDSITISPIENKLSYRSLNESINAFLETLGIKDLPYNERYESDYKVANPLFAIVFHSVIASDKDDAYYNCLHLVNQIFSIVGFYNEFRPSIVANFLLETGEKQYAYHFPFDNYKGNLSSSFDPNQIAKNIERLLPVLDTKPLAHVVLNDFSQAMNEKNYQIRHLRLWAILELFANRLINKEDIELIDANGKKVFYKKGVLATTKYTVCKVYQLIFQSKLNKFSYDCSVPNLEFHVIYEMSEPVEPIDGFDKMDLWHAVRCLYSIRNAVAHEGHYDILKTSQGDEYDKLATCCYKKSIGYFADFLEDIVKKIIDLHIGKL